MTSKKILFLVVLVILVMGIISFVATRKTLPESEAQLPTIPLTTIAALPETRKISAPPGVQFEFSTSLVVPKELPALEVSFEQDYLPNVKRVATFLGFSEQETVFETGIYDWKDGPRIFSYNPASKSISYSVYVDPNGASAIPKFSKLQVLEALKSAGIVSPVFAFSESAPIPHAGEGQNESLPLFYSEYNLRYPVDSQTSYEVFYDLTNPASGNIVAYNDTTVSSFFFKIHPAAAKKTDQRELLSPERILEELSKGNGSLVEINANDYSEGSFPTPAFSRVVFSSVRIAYILKDNLLVPFFILSGVGQGSTTQTVTYFLRASS